MSPARVGCAVALSTFALVAACNDSFRFDEPPAPAVDASTDPPSGTPVCTTNADCASLSLQCDVGSGRCVACLDDTSCAAPTARCKTDIQICVACLGEGDCGTRQRCDPSTSTCLDLCVDDDEKCPLAGFACDVTLGLCSECHTSSNCAGNPRGPKCDRDIGRCADCLGNTQCPPDRPTCDRRVGRCVECVSTAECAAGAACDPTTSRCISLP